MARTPRVDKNGLRKGPWSKEEDDKLRAYIKRYGHWNWREIPKFAGVSRCGKSCRLRWMNYLRPNIKHGNFTKEEEDLIVEMHNKIGNKWAKIATKLPGRSDNEIKNYWHTHLKKRVKSNQNDPENMYRETKKETNFVNNFVESSNLGDHDQLEASSASQSSSSLELSLANTHEYPNETNSSPLTPISCSTSVELTSTEFMVHDSLISSTSDPIKTYSNEYDDGNFWTDPFFADLDVVNNVFMAPSDSHEFIWSTMDLYSEYCGQFMM